VIKKPRFVMHANNSLDCCANRFEIEDIARYDLRAKLM